MSPKARIEIQHQVDDFTSQWRQNDIDGIYNNADPAFRRMLTKEEWVKWKKRIDESYGSLRQVRIVEMHRLAPTRRVYQVATEMIYDKGATRGSFTFNTEHDRDTDAEPRLLGAVLVDYSKPPPESGR